MKKANGLDVLMTIVHMLRAYSSRGNIRYDWDQIGDDEFSIVRFDRTRPFDDRYRVDIRKFKRSDLDALTPNDIMLVYKQLHREEFTDGGRDE